jgi:hypothetical protein
MLGSALAAHATSAFEAVPVVVIVPGYSTEGCEASYEESFGWGFARYSAPCQRWTYTWDFDCEKEPIEDSCFSLSNVIWYGSSGTCPNGACGLAIQFTFKHEAPCVGWAGPNGDEECDALCCDDGNKIALFEIVNGVNATIGAVTPGQSVAASSSSESECGGGGVVGFRYFCESPTGIHSFPKHPNNNFGTSYSCAGC